MMTARRSSSDAREEPSFVQSMLMRLSEFRINCSEAGAGLCPFVLAMDHAINRFRSRCVHVYFACVMRRAGRSGRG